MKKLGKNIKIGFFNYEVIYPYSFREVSKSAGQCDYIDQEIRIMGSPVNEDKVDDRVVSVLVHELIHAIGYVSGHPVFQNQDEQDDENAIDGWSEHLCMLLRENRWFLELFLSDDLCIVSKRKLEQLEAKASENKPRKKTKKGEKNV